MTDDAALTLTRLIVDPTTKRLKVSAVITSGGGITSLNALTAATQTFANDTNVTITSATSTHTLGWSGTLSLARGGTAAALTANNGGIVYSTASALAILAGTATAGQILRSGLSAAPSWSTATYPATAGVTAGMFLRSDGTNFGNSTLVLPNAAAVSTILYASTADTISALATANSGVLVTSGTGVPSISSTLPAFTLGGTVTLAGQSFSGIATGSWVARWSGGTAITAAQYEITRDADVTNQLHFNVPTGATFELSVNDVAEYVLSATQVDFNSNNVVNMGTLNTHTIQGGTSTLAMYSNNLSVFAATTSAQLAGVISDETGTGALVFAGSPAFTTQISTPSIVTASGALGITPAAGSNLNVVLSTTGDFVVNTDDLVVDTSAGNVGIGTTSPGANLQVGSGTLALGQAAGSRLLAIKNSGRAYLYLEGTSTNQADILLSRTGGTANQNIMQLVIETNNLTVFRAITDAGGVIQNAIIAMQHSTGNVGIGTSTFGTSAAGVLSIANGTAPTTGPADTVQFYSSDESAANTIPSFFCEGTNVDQATADVVATRLIRVRINGTIRTLMASS